MRKYLISMLLCAAFCVLTAGTIRAQILQQGIAGKILRFHVLANSDSTEDQELKLKVRNAVGGYLSAQLESAYNLEQSRQIVTDRIPGIEAVAAEVIRSQGYDYPVSASLEHCVFPQKTYGEFTFPAGTYEALRVVIGEGEGHNWWCVMYPNLCFAGSVYELDDETGERLRAELNPQEYAAVFDGDEVNIQFQILRFLNEVLE